ncbi:hypothetical protein PM082_016305 [Marasmius tenuissimus]|nr:hypothetical protein PM082_016305 [Marasmius tenuissimus]
MPFFYFTLFSFVVVAQALVARGPTCTQQYTVQSGDSCNAIENYFKLAPGTVRSLNSLVNAQCTNLYPGQSLCLSTSSSNPSGGAVRVAANHTPSNQETAARRSKTGSA